MCGTLPGTDGRVARLSKALSREESHGESACVFRFRAETGAVLAQDGLRWVDRRERAQFEVDVPAELAWAQRLIRHGRGERAAAGQ